MNKLMMNPKLKSEAHIIYLILAAMFISALVVSNASKHSLVSGTKAIMES